MHSTSHVSQFLHRRGVAAIAIASFAALSGLAHAQSISVPNFSFENPPQDALGEQAALAPAIPGLNDWQHAAKPGYFTDSQDLAWYQTAGFFKNVRGASVAYTNAAGDQLGYILALPLNGIFQDNNTQGDFDFGGPTHAFNALYEVGKAYKLTLGTYGKSMPEGTALRLSLYYRDTSNQIVPIQSSDVVFTLATFPVAASYSLKDYEVTTPIVTGGAAWAGKQIGVQLEVVGGNGQGYFDVDNVRLAAVPEPISAGLLGLGLAGLLGTRRRRARVS